MYSVYLISCGELGNKRYKIGYTKKPVEQRLKQLKTGNHQELKIEQIFQTKWGTKIESILHRNYKNTKVSGEWFDLSQEQVDRFLVECVNLEKFLNEIKQNSTFKNPLSVLNI